LVCGFGWVNRFRKERQTIVKQDGFYSTAIANEKYRINQLNMQVIEAMEELREIKTRVQSLQVPYKFDIGSVLNAYREGDLTFELAVEVLSTIVSAIKPSSDLNLDTKSDKARALHRVVRAMHDGHCMNCGYLAPAHQFESWVVKAGVQTQLNHKCPKCAFTVTNVEAHLALMEFQEYANKSVDVFKAWRDKTFGKTGS
jgi:hypothetical protein